MKKKLKKEYQPGGSKRHVILDKAVEYLTCLNEAASGDWDDLSKPWRTA